MVGFYTGSIGASSIEGMGLDAVAAPNADVLGAVAGAALANNPTPRIFRATMGGGLDAETQSHWQNYQDPAGRNATGETADIASERGAAPSVLSSEEANARYGIKGALTFDKPVSEAVASDLYDHHHADIVRQDTIARRSGGPMTGFAARGVVSLGMGLLDPLNLAAGLVPGFGEARIAQVAGLDLATSLGARVAARAVSGASGGAAGMAALEPLNYMLDQHEQNDWTMGEAMRGIAYGAVLGGGLHVGIQGLVGRVPRAGISEPLAPAQIITRATENNPEIQAMAFRGAIAQHVEGRAVDITPSLEMLAAHRDMLFNEAAGVIDRPPTDPARAERLRQIEEELTQPDPVTTADRIAAVEEELNGGVIPSARRQALNAELNMLRNGSMEDPTGNLASLSLERDQILELERARSEAQRQGLMTAALNVEDQMRRLRENAMRPAEHPDDVAAAAANDETIRRAEAPDATPRAASDAVGEAAPVKVDGKYADAFAEATRAADEAAQAVEAEVAAGRLSEAHAEAMRAADAAVKEAAGDAKAMEAAAVCLVRGI